LSQKSGSKASRTSERCIVYSKESREEKALSIRQKGYSRNDERTVDQEAKAPEDSESHSRSARKRKDLKFRKTKKTKN